MEIIEEKIFCSGWTNPGEQPDFKGKDGIQHSMQTYRQMTGKGKIRDIWTAGSSHAQEGAERKIHFYLAFNPLRKLQVLIGARELAIDLEDGNHRREYR